MSRFRFDAAAAVAPFNHPIAVFAGAGTGKTTTLIARVWHMVAQGIKPGAQHC